MKTLATLIRHSLTFLAGLGGMLATYAVIAPADASTVDAAGSALVEPLTTIGGLVAAGLARLIIAWLGKRFPSLAGLGTQMSGGASVIALMCMAAGLMGFCLPSCTTAQLDAARAVPIHLGLHTADGDVGYDSKSGLNVDFKTAK